MSGREESLEVKGFGWAAIAKGERVPFALLVVLVVVAFGALGWVHHQRMVEDHQSVKEAMAEMIYVLALSQEDRANLRIDMPDSLRRKLPRERGQ